jgi:large conductance mechanosensitive channel
VVDLAVGIVVGAAFTAVVTGLVADIITPLIPIPGGSLAGLVWMPPYGNTLVKWGAFINAALTFFIVTSVVYFFIVRPINALMSHARPTPIKEVNLLANIQDRLAVGVVSSGAVVYNTVLKQNVQVPITEVILQASAITTTLTMVIAVSYDGGTTFDTMYTSPAMTGAPRTRRVYFTPFTHADDADTAAVDANIYRFPLLAYNIRITVTASGSCTYNLDVFSSGAGME